MQLQLAFKRYSLTVSCKSFVLILSGRKPEVTLRARKANAMEAGDWREAALAAVSTDAPRGFRGALALRDSPSGFLRVRAWVLCNLSKQAFGKDRCRLTFAVLPAR
jgi:hypothetical protein